MIQRIQSLYLLLVFAAYVLLFFFPIAEFQAKEMEYQFSLLGITGSNTSSTIPLIIVVCLLALTCIITIFLFKKRMLQFRITAITLMVHIGFVAAVFYSADKIAKGLETLAVYKAGMYIALVPLVFLVLAHRAIRKDEKMLRSADRLR